MEVIILDTAKANEDHDAEVLLHDLRGLKDSHYPYQTTVIDQQRGNRRYVLATNHKDTQLGIGKLPNLTQLVLCWLFESTYQGKKNPQMAFTFEPKEADQKRRMLHVVRSEDEDMSGRYTTFHLSPIN